MKITQTRDIRTANRWEIMKQILHKYPISRVDLCNVTGLNKATVSTIVKEWIDAELLKETEQAEDARSCWNLDWMPAMWLPWTLTFEMFGPFSPIYQEKIS